ncbi:Crp/Fnr family transcriptional regulator [Methylobacterium oryzae CBMB20]
MIDHLIRKLELFARLSEADRVSLHEALTPPRSVAARTELAAEGDLLNSAQIILTGWACRYRQFADGRQQIISILLPGDLCEPAIPRQSRCGHALASLTPVTLAQIPMLSLRDVMARSPALDEAFQLEALSAAAIQREWTVSLGCRTGIERLAHLFCELYARLAAVGLADGETCPLPITQGDLADALGQTSVHINRDPAGAARRSPGRAEEPAPDHPEPAQAGGDGAFQAGIPLVRRTALPREPGLCGSPVVREIPAGRHAQGASRLETGGTAFADAAEAQRAFGPAGSPSGCDACRAAAGNLSGRPRSRARRLRRRRVGCVVPRDGRSPVGGAGRFSPA